MSSQPLSVEIFLLVRHSDTLDSVRAFLDSYLKHNSGADHNLNILYKGFLLNHFVNRLDVKHRPLFLPDEGYDVTTYWKASEIFPEETQILCFNCHTRIVKDDYLRKLLNVEGGLTGYFASWVSILDLLRNQRKHLKAFIASRHFHPYPNFHIRTNGFMLKAGTMKQITVPKFRRKYDAHRFESGKQSLTNQVIATGMKVGFADERLVADNHVL